MCFGQIATFQPAKMAAPPKLMELRPNRSLLNADFDGYKLSLAEIPTATEQLKVPVDNLVPDVNQYSILHAKLFVLHNHLISGPEENTVYFIDKAWNIQKFTVDPILNGFISSIVWQIPLLRERKCGDYNTSIKFTGDNLAVVSDGMGFIYILDTSNNEQWGVVYSGEVAGPDKNFVISDVIHQKLEEEESIHLLLHSIKTGAENTKTCTVLHWITLNKKDTWNQVALRELTVQGFVQYSYLELTGQALYIVSETGAKFTLDSENKIVEEDVRIENEKKTYTWSQNMEEIVINYFLPEHSEKATVKAEISSLQIKVGGDILLEGVLHQKIDPGLTCWEIEGNTLKIVLQKGESGVMWPEVVVGDNCGDYQVDSEVAKGISKNLEEITSSEEVMCTILPFYKKNCY